MIKQTYMLAIFPRTKLTPEHGRIQTAVNSLAEGEPAPAGFDTEKLIYFFNSSESSAHLFKRIDTACLDGDRFLLTPVCCLHNPENGGLAAIAHWLKKHCSCRHNTQTLAG